MKIDGAEVVPVGTVRGFGPVVEMALAQIALGNKPESIDMSEETQGLFARDFGGFDKAFEPLTSIGIVVKTNNDIPRGMFGLTVDVPTDNLEATAAGTTALINSLTGKKSDA